MLPGTAGVAEEEEQPLEKDCRQPVARKGGRYLAAGVVEEDEKLCEKDTGQLV